MILSPNQLFFLDSVGALITAFLTGVILTQLYSYFGMPISECYVLGGVAIILCIYSLICGLRLTKNHAPFLKIIAISNSIYCLVTACFVIYHFSELTKLGVTYFVVETLIVGFVVALEWRMANQLLLNRV